MRPTTVRPYVVRLSVRVDKVPTNDQIETLEGGPHQVITARRPRSRRMEVQLTMSGVDVVGVLARAAHHVLDRLQGEIVSAEVTPVARSVRR